MMQHRFHPFVLFNCLFLAFLTHVSCQKPESTENHPISNQTVKIDGMTMVAPPDKFDIKSSPFDAMKDIHISWVGIVPYAYTRIDEPTVRFGISNWQWWGETAAGADVSISIAHEEGMKVLLKPQVYVPSSWTGAISYKSEAEWLLWEKDYENYIMTFAELAAKHNVEIFCIGTEFKASTISRPTFWEKLIDKIKDVYKGKLTYAANWDEYHQIRFWDKLDYIGVDAYFPLTDTAVPSVEELHDAWRPIEKELRGFSDKLNVPILFTEYGYMSVKGCAGKTWILEKDRSILEYDEQAQANAFTAAHQVFWNKDYWAGGFIWKWYPHEFAGKDRMYKDYTPQNKLSEKMLSKWYKK